MLQKGIEAQRLAISDNYRNWKKWGPYLAERQWGTVREDYSEYGHAWDFVDHEKARSNAYRWGEEGIAGFCDAREILCLAPAFWNGKDPIIKERLFGLTNNQGNHGEDVKELYFHQESSPTHSYCKYLYKYPHKEFPYGDLVAKNQRSRHEPEFELLDTNCFNFSAYFDCIIEYAKADVDDILMKVTVVNRGHKAANIHVLPQLWFRNFWKHNQRFSRPAITSTGLTTAESRSTRNGRYFLYHQRGKQLFCENETNNKKIYGVENETPFVKDGINDRVVERKRKAVNPEKTGSKFAVWHKLRLRPGQEKTIKFRLSKKRVEKPWAEFDKIFEQRVSECRAFYDETVKTSLPEAHKHIVKRAFSGLLWTKQFYYYDVFKWLFGGPGEARPYRSNARNFSWQHLTNRHIISMPDKWEYPWYAAWDLAFHMASFVEIDPYFAKEQLLLVLRESYMHPNGQIPAYEWNFSDVNPPVHSWAVWTVYEKDKDRTGKGDRDFLEKSFQKLLVNFTWWVNQKDKHGTDLFEGGFLGLDNIGVFDRSSGIPGNAHLEQVDGTSWMALYCLNMLEISIKIAFEDPSYEEMATKFFGHFIFIAEALNKLNEDYEGTWDEEEGFFYDKLVFEDGTFQPIKVRSIVGIMSLIAVLHISKETLDRLPNFKYSVNWFRKYRQANLKYQVIQEFSEDSDLLLALVPKERVEIMLKAVFDQNEFLSDHGLRSLSKIHEEIYKIDINGTNYEIKYEPAESESSMFGGNSNWRGPVWMPFNYLFVTAIKEFRDYYGKDLEVEYPTGSGKILGLNEIRNDLMKRLLSLFQTDEEGNRPVNAQHDQLYKDANFKDLVMFYEYFHGDTGRGIGASHQTGWTALIANMINEIY